MLVTAKSAFVHIPKTGGTWIGEVLRDAARTSHPHDRITEPYPGRLTFAFVRDPVTWWRSYWQAMMHKGDDLWNPPGWDAVRYASRDYQEFMSRILENSPGMYSHAVSVYTAGVDRVGRFENLRADLAAILREAGEAVRVDGNPVNVTVYDKGSGSTSELDAAVRVAERQMLDEFYGGMAELGLCTRLQSVPPEFESPFRL